MWVYIACKCLHSWISQPVPHSQSYSSPKQYLPDSWLACKFSEVHYAQSLLSWPDCLLGFVVFIRTAYAVRLSLLLVVALGLHTRSLWQLGTRCRSFLSFLLLLRGMYTSRRANIGWLFITWGCYGLRILSRGRFDRRGWLYFTGQDWHLSLACHSKFFDWYKINY